MRTSTNNVDNNENSNMLFLLDDFGVQFDYRKKPNKKNVIVLKYKI